MSLLSHKYTPAAMTDRELDATFAARGPTVDRLLQALRDQAHATSPAGLVITGPRGAGKSTVIRMVALQIRHDAELSRVFLPVVLPEEQFGVLSLRDFLAVILRELAAGGLDQATSWLDRVESEPDDERSEQLAITGLKEVTGATSRRLAVFVENLHLLLDECLDCPMKGRLRRLLTSEPFMVVMGSAVHLPSSLLQPDEPLFGYFVTVPLDRLDARQVFELLERRAQFDGNERFLGEFDEQRSKVRAIALLSGGNPRLLLMLYELLGGRQVATMVQCLRRLVDELTPLLKDEMERLPPQQRKIVHALIEKGGTAQPVELVARTRLPLNAITSLLRRLKDAQIVTVLGGGKGRTAYYTFPDRLFVIWYQMRYLNPNRRRIELFVEVLRIWFEAEERAATVRSLAGLAASAAPGARCEAALTAEYFAASLLETRYASAARDEAVRQWLKSGEYRQAALAYAELGRGAGSEEVSSDTQAYLALGEWCIKNADLETAMNVLNPIIEAPGHPVPERATALTHRGCCLRNAGDFRHALQDFTTAAGLEGAPPAQVAAALLERGVTKALLGDRQGELADYNAVLELEGAPREHVAKALMGRGAVKKLLGDRQGELADYTAAAELDGAPADQVARALIRRGFTKARQGDYQGAVADYTAAATRNGASKDRVSLALFCRGGTRETLGDRQGAVADYTELLRIEGVPEHQVAAALFRRGAVCAALGRMADAIADWSEVVRLGAAGDPFVGEAAGNLFCLHWESGSKDEANAALDRFAGHLAGQPPDQRSSELTSLLTQLASPALRDRWVHAARRLMATQSPEVKEALTFLEPVCAVLEGGGRHLLDPLRPEQREFALSVLSRFESTEPDSTNQAAPMPV